MVNYCPHTDGNNPVVKEYDVAAFSYLAAARILKIDAYPKPNDGAEINSVIDTIAADGPIVVATLARLKIASYLLTNPVGADSDAREVIGQLEAAQVHHNIQTHPQTRTPFIVITSDNWGSRDWFSYTREVVPYLEQTPLGVLKKARLIYVDLYKGIETASKRVLSYCLENNLPLFLNISGGVSDEKLLLSVDMRGVGVIQASISDVNFEESEQVALDIFNRCRPQLAVVTTGAYGATAYDGSSFHYADAIPIQPLHVHGAGAAFSAGFLSKYIIGKPVQDCLDFGCSVGSLSCIKERIFEEISFPLIQTFVENSRR